jgi:hypothetical protein
MNIMEEAELMMLEDKPIYQCRYPLLRWDYQYYYSRPHTGASSALTYAKRMVINDLIAFFVNTTVWGIAKMPSNVRFFGV